MRLLDFGKQIAFNFWVFGLFQSVPKCELLELNGTSLRCIRRAIRAMKSSFDSDAFTISSIIGFIKLFRLR